MPSDGVSIGSGTLAGDFGGITIWTLWSNGNWCDLEGRFWYINLRLTSEYWMHGRAYICSFEPHVIQNHLESDLLYLSRIDVGGLLIIQNYNFNWFLHQSRHCNHFLILFFCKFFQKSINVGPKPLISWYGLSKTIVRKHYSLYYTKALARCSNIP